MGKNNTAIHQLVRESVTAGKALTAEDIKTLRKQNEKAVKLYKLVFWVAIAIFNVFLWVPMQIAAPIKMGVAGLALTCAFVLPIYGIRKHQKELGVLEEAVPGPKKSRASDAGRDYIASIRKEGRAFVRAEMEVLETSRERE